MATNSKRNKSILLIKRTNNNVTTVIKVGTLKYRVRGVVITKLGYRIINRQIPISTNPKPPKRKGGSKE